MYLCYCRCKDCGQFYITKVGTSLSDYLTESMVLNQICSDIVWTDMIRNCKPECILDDVNTRNCYSTAKFFESFGIGNERFPRVRGLRFYISDEDKFNQCDNLFEEYNMVILKGEKDCCPICGSSKKYKNYPPNKRFEYDGDSLYGLFDSNKGIVDQDKDFIAQAHYNEEAEIIDADHGRMLQRLNNESVALPQIQLSTDSIDIKQYLKGLLDVKVSAYSLERRLNDILHQQFTAKQHCINVEGKMRKSSIPKAQRRLNEINQSIDRIVNSFTIPDNWYVQQNITKPSKPSKPKPFTVAKPIEPVYKKPGFFNKKAIMAENEALRKRYESEYTNWVNLNDIYNMEVNEYEKALKEYNDLSSRFKKEEQQYKEKEYKKWIKQQYKSNSKLIKLQNEKAECLQMINNPKKYLDMQIKNSPAAVVRDMTNQDLEDCTNALKRAYEAEKSYLSLDILFPKYATLPAVATIYEYFMTGRCNELAGPNGAYNLFESEIRANRVIEQLDAISEKLDQIKSNQYTLYNSVQSVNSQLANLNNLAGQMVGVLNEIGSTTKDIKKLSTVTAYNTAETAYYSKVNTELTKALGYIIALK